MPALAAIVLGAGPVSQSRAAASLTTQLARSMHAAGGASGAYVYDVTTGQTLFSEGADTARPPASVEKLYTSITALQLLGPSAQLQTQVLGTGPIPSDGVWRGNLYLRGGGDPTFGSEAFISRAYGPGQGASVGRLAESLRHRGLTRVDGRILGDESMFDTGRGGPRTGFAFDHDLTGNLSALAFDRGVIGAMRGWHAPAAYAAQQLTLALRHLGVQVTGAPGAGTAPRSAVALTFAASPPLSTLLALQNAASDNFFAEMLVKVLGARFGGAGTTTAGAAVVRHTVAQLGVHPRVVDGSGLSRGDRTSPAQVVTLLTHVFGQPLGVLLRSTLPVAGHTGTLRLRMRGTVASGHCQAKTGTLNYVSNLAGWCDTAGGDTVAFAFEMDGLSDLSAHALQDAMTVALAGYGG